MKICAAQIKCKAGDIPYNIKMHIDLINKAIRHNFDVIVFSELSITGYEPTLAKKLAITPSDSRLKPFQELSNAHNLTICIGAPTIKDNNIQISMIIFQPNQSNQTYSKQLIHESECPFFVPGISNITFSTKGHTLNPAICYESMQHSHAKKADSNHADIYLCSVAKNQEGIESAKSHYSKIAKEHNFYVVMANCVGQNDQLMCTGQSGIWNKQGECLAMLNNKEQGLIGIDLTDQTIFKI